MRASAELLAGYYHAVHEMTLEFVETLTADDLARIVDRNWDPPVTASARLVSIVDDCAQHLGQAAYVWRGIASSDDRHIGNQAVHHGHDSQSGHRRRRR